MIDLPKLFPAHVSACLDRIDDVRGISFAAEAAYLATASPERQREFRAGRILAHRALAALGAETGAILRQPDRSPRWPKGIVGSITHSRSWCAAAAARRRPLLGLGLDVEETDEPPDVDWAEILTPRELAGLGESSERHHHALLHFSAKESVFKCLQAEHPGWLDFDAVEITFDAEMRRFTAELVKDDPGSRQGPIGRIAGCYDTSAELIVTTATLIESRRASGS